jgi:transposase
MPWDDVRVSDESWHECRPCPCGGGKVKYLCREECGDGDSWRSQHTVYETHTAVETDCPGCAKSLRL